MGGTVGRCVCGDKQRGARGKIGVPRYKLIGALGCSLAGVDQDLRITFFDIKYLFLSYDRSVPAMVSSTFTTSTFSQTKPEEQGSGDRPSHNPSDATKPEPNNNTNSNDSKPETKTLALTKPQPTPTDPNFTTLHLTIYIFRGEPYDTYNHRHALLYLTAPSLPSYHETVHTQRDEATDLWVVDRLHLPVAWFETRAYVAHVSAGSLRVPAGREMEPVDAIAAVPAGARPPDWNCQNFLYEGFQVLVDRGWQTQEWWDEVVSEMMDRLLDATVV